MNISKKLIFVSVALSLFTACEDDTSRIAITQKISNVSSVGYIYHGENGNRLVNGVGDFQNISPMEISLASSATWLVAATFNDSSIWAAVLENGSVNAFLVKNQTIQEIPITPNSVSPGTQPTLAISNNGDATLANVFENASPDASTIIVDNATSTRAYISNQGQLILKTNDSEESLAVNALNYSRILKDNKSRLLVLSDPTLSYTHQVLGRKFQNAAAISLIETQPEFRLIKKISIGSPDVIEGNALIWMDVDGDDDDEIITTLSNSTGGARIVIFSEEGDVLSSGTPIGTNRRWRHQLAVAPFNTPTELLLSSIYIPHLGPVLEYFRLDDLSLSRFNTQSIIDYTSHYQIALNLDMSLAGDFDSDGAIETLLLDKNTKSELAAWEYQNGNIKKDWTLPLSDKISSNLAATTLSNGRIALGVGLENKLLIWQN